MPCSPRAAMSISSEPDSPHSTEAAVKISVPAINTRTRPSRSPNAPPMSSSTDSVRM